VVVKGYGKLGHSRFFLVNTAQEPGLRPGFWHGLGLGSGTTELGDEGALLMHRLGEWSIPLVASCAKWKGVAWLNLSQSLDLILVDDALQHYALKPQGMILTASSPRVEIRLREGKARGLRCALSREDLKEVRWVFTQNSPPRAGETSSSQDASENLGCGWVRRLKGFYPLSCVFRPKKLESPEVLRGHPVYLLAGLGSSRGLLELCRNAGLGIERAVRPRDHVKYTAAWVGNMLRSLNPELPWVTTEKDAVKLKQAWFGERQVWVIRDELQWNRQFETLLWPWIQGLISFGKSP
jgi:tetraacyldisaccharide-1-P 4'-kinase